MSEQPNGVNGQPPNQPSLTLTFTVQEWWAIRAGLYELPGKIGIPIIGKLEPLLFPAANVQIPQPAQKEITKYD